MLKWIRIHFDRTFVNPSQYLGENLDEVVKETLNITVDKVWNETVKEAVSDKTSAKLIESKRDRYQDFFFPKTFSIPVREF